MLTCPKCKESRWDDVVKCHCKEFKIINEDGDEYAVWAMDERGAALKYAEESNCAADYYLMEETVKISVDGIEFNISAEADVHYSANQVSEGT